MSIFDECPWAGEVLDWARDADPGCRSVAGWEIIDREFFPADSYNITDFVERSEIRAQLLAEILGLTDPC